MDTEIRKRSHIHEEAGIKQINVNVFADEEIQSTGTKNVESSGKNKDALLYGISDIPPWYLCIILGVQHYLTAFGAMISIPIILAPALCLPPDHVAISEILCTLIFMSGLVTLLQSTFGTRLPILQGGTFSFLAPTFAILSLPQYVCPELPDLSNITIHNETIRQELEDMHTELWQVRMREIQGAIMLSSLFEVVIGGCGIMGLLLRYIGPLAIAPTVALIGLSLFQTAADACSGQWWIALATILCITIFSQFLRKFDIPCCKVTKNSSQERTCTRAAGFPLFSLFAVLLAIGVMWLICYILTITDTLPNDPDEWGYEGRTDAKIKILNQAQWFRFPYPFQWGMPTYSVAGVFGMLAGVLAGMLESVGDYYACARLSGAPPPPTHAINRGIFVEGIGCVLSGMWGSGNGTTSYAENIGAIGITRVGSRVVIQTAGLVMVLFGMLGKFGAFFVTIPEPVIGGVFMVTFGMITSVGLSNLQYVNMNLSRNLFVVGFSLFFGLSLPQWIAANPESINTGNDIADQIFTVLLSTSMFVGGVVGFILDNTIPGTDEDRGIHVWRHSTGKKSETASNESDTSKCYDLPWCMGCLSKASCLKYIPICPQFAFSPSCKCCKDSDSQSDSEDDAELSEVVQNGTMFRPVENKGFIGSVQDEMLTRL